MSAKRAPGFIVAVAAAALLCAAVPALVAADDCIEQSGVTRTTRTTVTTTTTTTDMNGVVTGSVSTTLPADAEVQVLGVSNGVTADEVRKARYDVAFGNGFGYNATYELAFVEKEGKAAILEGGMDVQSVDLTSPNIPERVKDYLEMGPLLGIVGARREFAVGETYDSVMLRPEGRPHFRYHCDGIVSVAGIQGYHLVVRSVRYRNVEMDMVLSPDYPFPLALREHTGENPISITLRDVNQIRVATVE